MILSLMLMAHLILGQTATVADEGHDLCNVASLPRDIQASLKEKYGAWKIQESSNLSKRARERWESERPVRCPGIAAGLFERATTLSYAILLVPSEHADKGYIFLVFSHKAGRPGYETQLVEKLDQDGAANYFIRSTAISKFFDKSSRQKFQAYTVDGILLVDSAENEYGVEMYFWYRGRYRREPIDY